MNTGASRSGASRARTDDLLHAMQALSQLSYSPRLARHCIGPLSARHRPGRRGVRTLSLAVPDGRASLRPQGDRAPLAAHVGRRAHLGGTEPRAGRRPQRRRSVLVRARDAALPQRRAAHRAPQGLLGRRRGRALPSPYWPARAAPDGLRRLRAPGREPRDRQRPASARLDQRGDRRVPAPVPRMGHLDRLVARVRHARAALLPLDAVDLPAALRARPGLPQGGRGQVVPERPDRSGQRAGDRRPLRALRRRGRGQAARAVAVPDHRLRRPPARRPRLDRVARARQDDAAQLDRTLRGRRGDVPLRGAGDRLPGLHHTPGHALRRDVLRHGAGAPRTSTGWRTARAARTRSDATSTTR